MSGNPSSSAHAFFASYRRAFEQSDAAAIADHFAYPCHITSDAGEIVLMPIGGQLDWIDKIEQLLRHYRTIGVYSAQIVDLATTELSPRLVQASVHWELHDAAGHVLYGFEAIYTLALINGRLRIAAIAHNETPKLLACLKTLRSRTQQSG